VQSEMGLNREKLIRMALLLGSDYTEGISGIGIVNAIEVVNAFPGEEGLKSFKKWVESPDLSLLGLQGKGTKKKGGHLKQKAHQVGNKEGYAASNGDEMVEDDSVDGITDVGDGDDVGDPDIKVLQQEFMEKHVFPVTLETDLELYFCFLRSWFFFRQHINFEVVAGCKGLSVFGRVGLWFQFTTRLC
jgi:DNA excision repair protein ERCC-5